ncbi:hypothetical protein CMI38_04690 [Candidatus Pacearchaeota archaeon]|jgi:hypothetical protein|nr:hypothetical protein [Candidatus Pacearchaeota archaeon]|tara:strand:+ start:3918 stop:4292 length:375 start_codon:yes stop_codon:yes gene_type:complete
MTVHAPKPKPRKKKRKKTLSIAEGQKKLDNLEELTVKVGYTDDKTDYETGFTYDLGADDWGNTNTTNMEASYTVSGTVSVSEGFMVHEEKHEDLRKLYPGLKKAYEQYRVLLKMAESGPEDLDN